MATVYLAGDAPEVAGVYQGTITGYDATTTYRVTINGKTVSTLGTGGTVTTTATALAALLNASTLPEFAELTWSSNAGAVIGTMDESTTGRTATITSSVSGGAGTFGAFSATTSPDGPNALTANNCKNTSGTRALPVNSDTFTIHSLDTDLRYGLNALSGVTLATLDVESSFTGEIYLPFTNEDGTDSYQEYRPRYLQVGATLCYIGRGEGDGSGMIAIDFGSVATTCYVLKTGASSIDGRHAFIFKGTNAGNVLRVMGDSTCEIAPFPGDATTIATVFTADNAQVRLGPDITAISNLILAGNSVCECYSTGAITNLNLYDSATLHMQFGSCTTMNIYGSNARVFWNSGGSITTLNIYAGAIFDTTSNTNSFTITTINVNGICTINDPNSRMAVTNALVLNGVSLQDLDINLRTGRAITIA